VNIIQFLRIVWAWRRISVLATLATVSGALIVILAVPPRWEAHTRVMLDTIKPDPLTGQVIGGAASAYAATQVEVIKDNAVAEKTVEQLGWLSDPILLKAYRNRAKKKDGSDFRHWLAQFVIDRTEVKLLPGTNILEITYTAPTPQEAKTVANALTSAYVDASVQYRRAAASRDADWFRAQAEKARADLDTAAKAEAEYQRQTGLVLQDDKTDVESARLRALASGTGGGAPVFTPIITANSPASAELAEVDAQIAQATQSLGPNHPQLQALKSKRAAVTLLVAQEEETARAARAAASSNVGALDRAMEEAKSKVLAQSGELEHLKDLHAEVTLREAQYTKTAARAAELQQEAMIGDTGLTVLGQAAVPQKPKFPNKPLILGGSLALGLVSGLLIGLLLEFLARRVCGFEDLQAAGVPVIAAIPALPRDARATNRFGLHRWPRRRVAEAAA
jgi:polysaccharide biosynthesis transport protein